MTRRDIPNLITLLRILLVLPFFWAALDRHYGNALCLFFVAGISDGLDGALAKHYGWTSRLGSILDPLADKLLLIVAFGALTQVGLIPLWLTVIVLARDVIIVLGAVIYHFWIGHYQLAPAFISKVNTFVQISLILAALISSLNGNTSLGHHVVQVLIYLTLMTTALSGLQYVVIWGRRALASPACPHE